MAKYNKIGKVISQYQMATDIYSMWIEMKEIAHEARPGQFISLYCKDASRLLPRPISICELNGREGIIRIVYRVVGHGTEEFSGYQSGDTIKLLGPLGNGFPLENKKKAFLIGGGIGIPPLLELAKNLECKKEIILGYRSELFLQDELDQYGNISISTEDGSRGVKGTVIDAIRENNLNAEVIYACGPTPMLRAVKEYAREHNMEAWISMEEKMACGIGACLACVCRSKDLDDHSHVHNKRICKDGPVFLAEEIQL